MFLQMYLMKYGYMDVPRGVQKSAPRMSQDGLRDYIKEFQSFAGLAPDRGFGWQYSEADEHPMVWS